jgi:DNA-binding CsgD family transcriptional regulator
MIRRVLRLVAEGMSQRKIAKELNVARNTIQAISSGRRTLQSETRAGRTLYGAKRKPAPTSKNPYRKRAAAMYRSGKTLAQIGEAAGVSRERVRQWLVKDGLSRKDRGRTRRD